MQKAQNTIEKYSAIQYGCKHLKSHWGLRVFVH